MKKRLTDAERNRLEEMAARAGSRPAKGRTVVLPRSVVSSLDPHEQLAMWMARAREAQLAIDALTNDEAIRKAATPLGPPVVLELDGQDMEQLRIALQVYLRSGGGPAPMRVAALADRLAAVATQQDLPEVA